MKLSAHETEAVEFLREWARAGFPRRADGSFPPDFITAMRRLMDVAPEAMSYHHFEEALCAGPDADVWMPRHHLWSGDDRARAKEALS